MVVDVIFFKQRTSYELRISDWSSDVFASVLLMVLDSARESASMVVVWTVILVTSLLTIVGFARAGSTVFWKSTSLPATGADPATATGTVPSPARSEVHTSELQSLMRISYAV